MIGLIKKDFYVIQKYMRTMSLLVLFYAAIQFVQPESQYVTSVITFLGVIIMFTIVAYDEQSKWDTYAKALPLSSKEIVLARYQSAMILIVICGVMSFLMGIIFNILMNPKPFEQWVLPIWLIIGIVILLDALLMPVMYKFGIEKSRFVLMGVVVVPMVLTAAISKSFDLSAFESIKESTIVALMIAFPFVCILLFVASYFVSVSVFDKKEF